MDKLGLKVTRRHHRRVRRVGLLGGSFNPAHDGHLFVSRQAMKRLDLDAVWWLVSPQNPLKSAAGMAPLEQRMDRAMAVARDPRVGVTDIENDLGTFYTIDTLTRLTDMFPATRFVWLMGADNLAGMDRWRGWQDIFRLVPIAVFDRPTYSLKASAARAARRFERARVPANKAHRLAWMKPPAWVFLRTGWNPRSSTRLRARHNW